jgi:spermidine/putrescine transport system permease protein
VTLPLMMPAILAGGLLAFVISFDNITATMFWRPGGLETVPTLIYAMLRDSISPEINALGTLVVALTVGIPIIGGQIIRRLR